jgi:hypothetical protein
MKLMLKGALHVHSTYSDGEFTLAELRQIFLSEECRFVCMSDHAEYFDEVKVKAYRDECHALSDEDFVFVPGLEYRCERQMHILGYGATAPTDSNDPQTVIAHIDSQSAVSVIAHPKDEFFEWIESFEKLPQGIETWNTKYDGRYAPRPGTFALLQRLRARQPHMHAFYGQDLHWRKQFRGLFVQLECASPEPAKILRALADGNYAGQKGEVSLPSSGVLPQTVLDDFEATHRKSQGRWRFVKRGKETLDRMGIKVPDSLKAQLRRIF